MGKKRSKIFSTQFITPAISTTLVLVLLGIIALFVVTAHNLSTYVKENINVSVLISDELSDAQIESFRKSLEAEPYSKEVTYISKEDALKEEIVEQGLDPTEFIGMNPYTASFEIKVAAAYANPDSLATTVSKLRGHSDVVDVIYSKDLVQSVNSNIKKISIILLVVAALFTYISFALINNMVRLRVFAKRFTINTMKLVGASWNFILKPYMVNSLLLGIISALFADTFLFFSLYWLYAFEPQIANVIDLKAVIIVFAAVMVFGIVITALCTLVSVNRYLRMTSNELYYL